MTLLSFALQSVLARPRSWVVGLLALGSAVLLTLGAAFVEGISEGTRRSIIESGTGHLQVYNSKSAEQPVVVMDSGGTPDLTPLPDYPALEAKLRAVEGVHDVVPMEVGLASVFRGNYLDEKLAAVRTVAREPASEARDARLARLTDDLEHTLRGVAGDARRRTEAFLGAEDAAEDKKALEAVTTPEFWQRFRAAPLESLEYLENRVARQAGEGESIDIEYLGSDLEQFPRAFPRFELVTGTMPPPGQRGLVLGHGLYEKSFKLPLATRLDELKREHERGATFADDERLRTLVERNGLELPDLLARLDVERAAALQAALARVLNHAGELEPLLREFLALDDDNFDARYKAFYAELAPHLPMYRVKPGDTLVLRSSAGLNSVPVKVWGTFRFKGLGGDTSRVNTLSALDLVTARHLSGRRTQAEKDEARRDVEALGMGGAEASADAELLPAAIVETEAPAKPKEEEAPRFERLQAWPETIAPGELRGGSVLQAALVLSPDASQEDVAARIDALAKESGLPLATVDWEMAGGFISGVVGMTQVVLLAFAAMLALFVVLVSAGTLLLLAQERVGEVGTLRAVGMQRREAFSVLLMEGLLLGGLGAGLGVLLSASLLRVLVGDGVSVHDETLQFFMGGPVLMPKLSGAASVGVVLGILAVVLAASLVPAWRGSSVSPVAAMRKRED
ncbi:FtsX-like permease family protein [Pyxidicoccus parkwayensis]|uniref:FtsX-like permease family protein n=1 Tax=Pyxidicoccus parkwayensis TaxID=2813578 RepID=UPI001F504663|nr:FtsX-like permease family protein [Pyxidicoccus parkwaysis]